jgi:hypothetical protein
MTLRADLSSVAITKDDALTSTGGAIFVFDGK